MTRDVDDHFGATAAKYTASASHATGHDLALLVEHLPLRRTSVVADVATGTGHTALALAPHVARVIGVDRVPAMLAEARQLGAAREVANATWVCGDTASTGFAASVFDIVTCRRAAHHFADIHAFLAETRRILRPGGTFGLIDQVPPEDEAAAALTEAMEKLHDPSHGRALPASEWEKRLAAARFQTQFWQVLEDRVSLDQFAATAKDPAAARVAVDGLLDNADGRIHAAIGLGVKSDGARSFIKRRLICVAGRR